MTDKVRRFITKHHMIEMGDRIVLGVSGGADSVALLCLLAGFREEWELTLSVVHVHHGIRKEAEEDVVYVKELCEKFDVPCYVFYEDVPALATQQKMSEEEAGRQCRYHHFYEVADMVNANKLAVAHHMDDQAETVLFHLIRGTGMAGIRGMQPVSHWEEQGQPVSCRMIRPLLCCRKKEITEYLERHEIPWKEDGTNGDNRYARNRIRNVVIPELQQINEQSVAHMADFAQNAAEYEQFFQNMVKEYRKQEIFRDEKGYLVIDRSHLLQKEPVFIRAVLYEAVCEMCGRKKDITGAHIQAVYDLLTNQSGRKCILPYETEAVLSYEKLIIGKCFVEKTKMEEADGMALHMDLQKLQTVGKQNFLLQNQGVLTARLLNFGEMEVKQRENLLNAIRNSKNNYTKYFGCDTIKNTLHIRKSMENDYLVIDCKGSHKKLSRYFIDAKVPVYRRKNQLVVACGNEILWVIGSRRSEGYRVCMDTQYVLELRYEGEKHELSY